MSDDPLVVFFFVASWGLLGIGGFFLFYVGKNAAFKRRYFPWFAGLTGLLFVGIAASAGVPVVMLGILLLFAALITYLSIRGTQFCSACGKTVSQEIPFPEQSSARAVARRFATRGRACTSLEPAERPNKALHPPAFGRG
ncbi:MAG: hypothetical protein DME01_21410 [Candidatus Rokuibacteriota bacterium]|nr:MAG: hypothetical protein DME01_21410 [Candidatus Rokubacteria bacterium]